MFTDSDFISYGMEGSPKLNNNSMIRNIPWLLLLFLVFTACPPRETVPEPPYRVPNDLPTEANHTSAPGKAIFTHWKHRPLHPGNGEPVHFMVKGQDAEKVLKIELAIYEYELYTNEQGLPSKRKRPDGMWGIIGSVQPDQAMETFEHSFTFPDGFPAHSNVEYIFTIYATDGTATRRMALFDAGDSPWPNDKILLYATSREPLGDKINLCFFPDTDYQENWSMFLDDASELIFSGYHSSNKIKDHKDRWAFYYTRQQTDGLALSQDPFNPDRYPAFMTDSLIMGIDAFGLLHRQPYSDGAYINSNLQFLAQSVFTSESYNWGTAIHETAHVVFHLSDEYNGCHCFSGREESNAFTDRAACENFNTRLGHSASECTEIIGYDGQTWYLPEAPPLFATEAECRAYNLENGLPVDSCRLFQDFTGPRSYQAFKGVCMMQDDGDAQVPNFRHACSAVIDQYYENLYPNGGDAGPSVLMEAVDNFFGYEPVMVLDVSYNGTVVDMTLDEVVYGVPTKNVIATGDLHLSLAAKRQGAYELAIDRPDCIHIHHGKGEVAVETAKGAVHCKVAVPLMEDLQTVACQTGIVKKGGEKVLKIRKELQQKIKAAKFSK